jgi:hypothetical protein
MLYRVNDHPELVKDSHTKAVLNTDLAAVRRHEERLLKVNKELQRDKEIGQLKNDMNEVKNLLGKLLEKLG